MKECNSSSEIDNHQQRTLQPAKLSFNLTREIRTSKDKGKLKPSMSTYPALQKILKGLILTEVEGNNHNHEKSGKS
jgi:hypothetical protein